jgi:catechol 2,3-dioxygenase-like lactoylglutathione lyase family enzyme
MVARPAREAVMLSTYSPMATLAVKDLAAARSFYEGTLGFTPSRDDVEGVLYSSGSGSFLVYESSYAGSNKATYLGFEVPDGEFDAEIDNLRGKVEFQTFEMDGTSWSDGVATMGEMRGVWFADPSGNLISVGTSTR